MTNYRDLHDRFILNTFVNRGIVIKRGKGVFLEDENGKKYLDLGSNYGVNILGHNHPYLIARISAQFKKLTNLHCSFISDVRSEAARLLVERASFGMEKVYFANSGSEAIEVALKLAIYLSGKSKVLAFDRAFHGKTLGALALTSDEKYKKGLPASLFSYVKRARFNDVDDLKEKFTSDVGVVVFEPVQGDGGIIEAHKDFLNEIYKLAKKNNAIIVVDEIQSGCGRTGKFLALEWYDIEPDIIVMGKGLAGGFPVGAVLFKKGLSDKIPKLFQTSTFGGNPLVAAGILAILDWLTDEVLEDVSYKGEFFLKNLRSIKSKLVKEVRGKGLMVGVEMKKDRDKVLKTLQQRGVIALPASEDTIRFLPPYIITTSQLKRATKVLEESLKWVEKNLL